MKKVIADIKIILSRSEKRRFVALIFLNTVLSVADIASIAFVFIVLSIYNGQSPEWLKPFLQRLNIEMHSLAPAVILIIVFVIKNIVGYFIIKAQSRYIADVAARLATKNLLLYFEGSYEDYVNIDTSVWMRRICFQAQEFSQYVLSSIQQIVNEVIMIIITILALAFYNAKVLLIVSLILLPAVVILSYITKKRLKNTRENIKSANEVLLQYLNESISGFVESNMYSKNEFFTQRYQKSQFILSRFVADMQVTQQMPARFFETFAVLGLFIFIVIINLQTVSNNNSIFMLGAFIAAAYKIIPGISKIINYTSQLTTYSFTITEIKKAAINKKDKQMIASTNIEKIELQNIHFSYKDNIVLNDFNCIILKGNFIGINGASGKGKTTLIDLILGFLSPQSGNIFFNNEIINTDTVKKFWPQIAYVKQTSFLLHDSILNNIILFENNYDQQKLNNVIAITGMKNWLNELKDGVNTIIAADGKNISGGQKQRIAIARALYKDAPVIILDEPFNELDEASELSMLYYFKELTQHGKIVILITHNMHSFSFCNSVITLK